MPYDMDYDAIKLAQAIVRAQAAAKPAKKNWGNPAPLALAGLVMTLTPLSCQLMGWRGADQNGFANNGANWFCGGLLLFLGGLLEFFLGHTFAFVVYAAYGGFFLALGATLTPGFNAEAPYMTSSAVLDATFYQSFGFFYLFVGVLSFVFFVCSLRTNICLVLLFLAYTIAFPLLAAAEWTHADGNLELSNRLLVGGGAACFVVSACSWWAMIGGLLESVDFPFTLPMGDLSRMVPGASQVDDVEAAPGKME
ncbi:GPR1/FUN34/yaaH family-domain-containing protein [Podospora aff. communis PSN243]|uniref:GPR1/FUN34/yaaH family-domain-containing protein n=1 Tax=Podospora aff. communis PSN243 TaxID=3040156 RepID=A0AAV9GSR5_9PEZI|nr:GPR1/FUN34/yaaH family-domain-containing protein [Podospora aff. communis PSN243]